MIIIKWLLTNRTKIRSLFISDSWESVEPCDVLLVRHDNDCGYLFEGKRYAQIIDSLGELCQRRGLKIQSVATPFSLLSGSHAFFSPVTYNRVYQFIDCTRIVIRALQGKEKSIEWMRSRLEKLWIKILLQAQPKIVIGIQPYPYICRAAKKMKIPIYDLQHGAIYSDNPWYGEKYRLSTPLEELPDGFLCWDEPSAVTVETWGKQKGLKVLIVGNPWFSRFITRSKDDQLVDQALSFHSFTSDRRPVILVSLQWGMGEFYPEKNFNGFLITPLEQVILETMDTYHWILRLHPVQLNGDEKEVTLKYLSKTFGKEKSTEWFQYSFLPLQIILQQTDLHITDMSTVVIEAAWMGVRSAILNQCVYPGGEWETLFSREREAGIAEVIAQNPYVIKQWITSNLAKGRFEPMMKSPGPVLDAFIRGIE